MSEIQLAVNEIFGPTFQGEGKNMGVPTMFLRLAGCNLHCVWCDTKYAWDWKHWDKDIEIGHYSWGEVFDMLKDKPVRHLVISGGEPMLQQKGLMRLIQALYTEGWLVEIETAGTIPLLDLALANLYTVSLKLSNSGNTDERINPVAIKTFQNSGRAIWKFVVTNPVADFLEIDALVNRFQLAPVYIMPEGISPEALNRNIKEIAEMTIKRRYILTTRLQVIIYGNKRAV